MKLRHVRAVAVFGIAIVALTGARGHHGGSCSGGSSHSSGSSSHDDSSSSSTSGGSGSRYDSDSNNNSTSSSGTSGGSSSDRAERDVTIDSCKYDGPTHKLVAKLTVKNSGALDRTYDITMTFRGAKAVSQTASARDLAVTAGASVKTEAATRYSGSGDGSEYTECVVTTARRR
ncbi:hypothetical protein ABT160_37555 [Streptomyces sp. NPDC001941]|uniref:hypothetical protein n=1 Tax=Streptomyces sp. NPDC001941 TaxID=3154659 RepID=UPI00331EDFD0